MVIHKSAWLYDSSISCIDSLSRLPVGGYTSSPVVLRGYTSYTYHIASRERIRQMRSLRLWGCSPGLSWPDICFITNLSEKNRKTSSCGLCTKQHNATCKMSYAKVEDDSSLAFLCHLFLTEWWYSVISTVSANEPTVDYDLPYCLMLSMQSQHMARAKVVITMLRHLNPVAQFVACGTCPYLSSVSCARYSGELKSIHARK